LYNDSGYFLWNQNNENKWYIVLLWFSLDKGLEELVRSVSGHWIPGLSLRLKPPSINPDIVKKGWVYEAPVYVYRYKRMILYIDIYYRWEAVDWVESWSIVVAVRSFEMEEARIQGLSTRWESF
jgi:hypothetical protein